jgi:hypothetical protein
MDQRADESTILPLTGINAGEVPLRAYFFEAVPRAMI